LVIVGAGPAGISASLAAKKHGLKSLTIEQESLGGAVFHFPRAKVVMTSPMDLPLYGKIKLTETKKSALLDLWNKVLRDHDIKIMERTKADSITPVSGRFRVKLDNGKEVLSRKVLLAIGRRGTPRKLNVPGEEMEKVAYRLLEPELVVGKNVMIVGGGDSAVESAIQLGRDNKVTLSYRGDSFSRIKPKNSSLIKVAMSKNLIDVRFQTNVDSIGEDKVVLKDHTGHIENIPNDLVYIFAGGELPTEFLEKAGIQITRKFGEALLKH
jgi:thioredoxin reductase